MSRITRVLGTTTGPLLLALLIGAATFVGVLVWLPNLAEPAPPPAVKMTSVVVATDDLAAGTLLDASGLRLVEVPTGAVLAGAVSSIEDAEGYLLRYPVSAGEQVMTSRFVTAPGGASSGLAFVVPTGMRAVSVPVTETSGAGGLLVPGDRVDVLAVVREGRVRALPPQSGAHLASNTEQADLPEQNQRTVVITVLQDALVLAVGQATADPSSVARTPGAQRIDAGTPDPDAVSVTIAVVPADAQKLFLAVNEGSIGLALRAFGDTSQAALLPLLDFDQSVSTEMTAR